MALALQRMNMRASVAPSVASRGSAFMASPVAPVRVAIAPVKASPVAVTVECKAKTRKAAAKRFKVTGSGKVMGRRSCKQHFNEKMTRDEIREHSKMFVLSPANLYNAVKCLPNHGIGK
ncbi:hypothetical protein PLESTB_001415900 [Pleodorina starrii]|uniref:50S ribosomal protein L35 n=1 Tax=Pleodorina starrii TaxID=330485 RepID=A0A9W6F7U5_9CHLO|nr:hypothetical protein PLESTM_001377400 [Pleodorina starrii]GLC58906.1 hypothetical protein PLESTB_001415900 [Pleodorina starrii]GLC65066.1 hypothetical protein PLESTF_000242900 [Pleodorina starrii]